MFQILSSFGRLRTLNTIFSTCSLRNINLLKLLVKMCKFTRIAKTTLNSSCSRNYCLRIIWWLCCDTCAAITKIGNHTDVTIHHWGEQHLHCNTLLFPTSKPTISLLIMFSHHWNTDYNLPNTGIIIPVFACPNQNVQPWGDSYPL